MNVSTLIPRVRLTVLILLIQAIAADENKKLKDIFDQVGC